MMKLSKKTHAISKLVPFYLLGWFEIWSILLNFCLLVMSPVRHLLFYIFTEGFKLGSMKGQSSLEAVAARLLCRLLVARFHFKARPVSQLLFYPNKRTHTSSSATPILTLINSKVNAKSQSKLQNKCRVFLFFLF